MDKIRKYRDETTMNTNICRPFTLYNDFIPPVSEDHSDWRYISFGYYDGFERGENYLKTGSIIFNAYGSIIYSRVEI